MAASTYTAPAEVSITTATHPWIEMIFPEMANARDAHAPSSAGVSLPPPRLPAHTNPRDAYQSHQPPMWLTKLAWFIGVDIIADSRKFLTVSQCLSLEEIELSHLHGIKKLNFFKSFNHLLEKTVQI